MNTNDYPACIKELFDSEVLGEQLFDVLIEAARNEREKFHFTKLRQLESETKIRLLPLLEKYDLAADEESVSVEPVAQIVELYRSSTWPNFLAGIRPLVDQFLARFEEIAAMGPIEDRSLLEYMVSHENAYVYWIDKEIAGEPGALDIALGQLHDLTDGDLAWSE